MSAIAYYRVSTTEQSIEMQRAVLSRHFVIDKEFLDEGISGAVLAASRPGFKALLDYVRDGDTVYVHAVDRLGRDALDIQSTIRYLIERDVNVHVQGLGMIARGAGELIIAVLAQVADMERLRIMERTANGRETAKRSLALTGKTHRGKESLGRPLLIEPKLVRDWRLNNEASIRKTALHFNLSDSTVKRYCAGHS